MKKCFIVLASLLLFLSCEKSEGQSEDPVKEYELVDIKFAPVGEGKIDKVNVTFQGGHAKNATATSAFYSGVAEEAVDDKSVFIMNGVVPREIESREDIYVKVPDVMGEEFPEKVLFGSTPQYTKRIFKYEAKNAEVPPFHEYLVICQINGYKQSNEFTATFKEIHSGEKIEIKGEWSGTKYANMESNVTLRELK